MPEKEKSPEGRRKESGFQYTTDSKKAPAEWGIEIPGVL